MVYVGGTGSSLSLDDVVIEDNGTTSSSSTWYGTVAYVGDDGIINISNSTI